MIDEIMERASRALVATDYFACEALCERALLRARRAGDFERLARACLPLQEARRQMRHQAVDAGVVRVVRALPLAPAAESPGCFLVEPPLVGVDARGVRAQLARRKVPSLVLAREPAIRAGHADKGKIPIVAVGGVVGVGGPVAPAVVRVRVDPPPGGEFTPAWIIASQEALGDAAIAQVDPAWPADHRVDDLLERLEGIPDHEKLIQALERAAREAAILPQPTDRPRRRAAVRDEWGF
ncbi:MAG: hypothetical protein SFY69_03810 [Planctomycetota bacterium]|nr:hypothetical protein [Planctomycetota bacterium]